MFNIRICKQRKKAIKSYAPMERIFNLFYSNDLLVFLYCHCVAENFPLFSGKCLFVFMCTVLLFLSSSNKMRKYNILVVIHFACFRCSSVYKRISSFTCLRRNFVIGYTSRDVKRLLSRNHCGKRWTWTDAMSLEAFLFFPIRGKTKTEDWQREREIEKFALKEALGLRKKELYSRYN